MASILFDKMQAARRLESEGPFTRQQAETLAEVYHNAMTQSVATKPDIELLRSDMQQMRSDMQLFEARLRTTIAEAFNHNMVTILGIIVPLIIASGRLQHFWK